MTKLIQNVSQPKLSICMATFNRSQYISETLDSILKEIPDGVELVIVNGASPDNTDEVVAPYLLKYPQISYYHEKKNSGVDEDFDKAVNYARGKYCWLMPDDDLIIPGAISSILKTLQEKPDLVVINSECWNANFSKNLHTKMLSIKKDERYTASDNEQSFLDLARCLSYIGSVIIERRKWLARDRVSYYGSLFIHVGVIYQNPPLSLVIAIAKPLIKIRYGNSMWTPRTFEIWYLKWPKLIWSFNYSEELKVKVVRKNPTSSLLKLFKSRALGQYSRYEYKIFISSNPASINKIIAWSISIYPKKLANLICVFYHCFNKKNSLFALFDLLRSSQASVFSRIVAYFFNVKVF